MTGLVGVNFTGNKNSRLSCKYVQMPERLKMVPKANKSFTNNLRWFQGDHWQIKKKLREDSLSSPEPALPLSGGMGNVPRFPTAGLGKRGLWERDWRGL